MADTVALPKRLYVLLAEVLTILLLGWVLYGAGMTVGYLLQRPTPYTPAPVPVDVPSLLASRFEVEDNGRWLPVCTAEWDGRDAITTAKHCIDIDMDGNIDAYEKQVRYRVVHGEASKVVRGGDFRVIGDDIVSTANPVYADPKVGDTVVVATHIFSKPLVYYATVVYVGTVEDIGWTEMVSWLKPSTRIVVLQMTSYGGCSGSPAYSPDGRRWVRVGVLSGGGMGMTILTQP